MNNIVDALFLERRKELRLVSNVTYKDNPLVFSVTAYTVQEAHEIMDVLGITHPKLDSQMIDAGIR